VSTVACLEANHASWCSFSAVRWAMVPGFCLSFSQ